MEILKLIKIKKKKISKLQKRAHKECICYVMKLMTDPPYTVWRPVPRVTHKVTVHLEGEAEWGMGRV